MDKEADDAARVEKLKQLDKKELALDDKCYEIWLTLVAYGKLRFIELLNALKKLDIDMTNPTLKEHLNHLIKKKMIKRKVEGFQNVSYGLTDEIHSLIDVPQEEIAEWLELSKKDEGIPAKLRSMKFDVKEYYGRMPEKQLDQEIDRALNNTLALGLFELGNMIDYDLKIDKYESDVAFWKFIGNPMCRMHEKSIAIKCRESEVYKKRLFEKMEKLIEQLRSNRSLHKP